MPKRLSAVFTSVGLLFAGLNSGLAENSVDYSVQASATVQTSPAAITLHWLPDTECNPQSYTVHRRTPGEESWDSGVTLPGTATSYTDAKVKKGVPYEYQIVKHASSCSGYGYLYAGINVPASENRG